MKLIVLVLAVAAMSAPATAQAWQPDHGDTLAFDVLRDGGAFGTHIVTFTKTGDALTVKTDVQLKVAFGPITFFDYSHDVTERYAAGKLMWVGSRTKNEGNWKTLTAEANPGGLKVSGVKFKGMLAGPLIPSTHWNQEEMKQASMFSTETGEMLPMKVTDRGLEKVKVGKTGSTEARRYDVDSEIDASFWYDSKGRWVKCAFTTQGSRIEYVLRQLPD